MSRSNDRRLYAFEKPIITSSHMTASDNLLPERWGPAVPKSARGLGKSVYFLVWMSAHRLRGPYLRDPQEMRLQSGVTNVARQLLAICCQAHAF
jgi:hypothetical protein